MEAAEVHGPDPLPLVTVPVAIAVAVVVAAAWYVTWATTDLVMMLTEPTMTAGDPALLGTFYALLVIMMVAMMLPSALPMIVAHRALTRMEGGRPVRPADNAGTVFFVLPYFFVWGAFSLVALFGLVALGLMGMFGGNLAFVPAAVLAAAGLYQFTRPKEVCLTHCESPLGFVVHHWRSGRAGALRMGTRHAWYCVGCCWLFMVVLFVVGAMSLPWMAVVSVFIFAEKVDGGRHPVSRAIGVVLLGLAVVFAAAALAA